MEVAVIAFEPSSATGFEQIAFAPSSDPNASVYIRLRAVKGPESPPYNYSYYSAAIHKSPVSISAETFYKALLQEQQLWNRTLDAGVIYSIPGKEGQRQVDMARGALVASLSLYINLQPNYGQSHSLYPWMFSFVIGDGEDYWSPQIERGGSLPFQEIAVVSTFSILT